MLGNKSPWLVIAILVVFLGPLLVVGVNHALDAAFQGRAQPMAPSAGLEASLPETCAPPLDPALDAAVAAIVPVQEYDSAVSRRIAELFQADQAARAFPVGAGAQIAEADRQRRVEVLGYLQAGQVQTTQDLVAAAFIFQHGNCPEHYLLANRVAQVAMDAGDPEARWIYAATYDRYLTSQGKPQKFGTQYTVVNGRYELYPVDPATTDEERRQYDVPTLAEAQARAGARPMGGTVIARVLLSWWLTWVGVGYALVGVVGTIVFPRNARVARIALAIAALAFLLSIAGHLAEILAFASAQVPLQVALGLAGAGLLLLAVVVVIRSRPARSNRRPVP
jgi:hypothetical protein